MAKLADLETLALLMALPDDTALLTEEAAVIIRSSQRTMERWRGPEGRGEGPHFSPVGGKVVYRKKDLLDWMEKNRVSSTVEAAVRKGLLFSTLADLAEERPYWRTPAGRLGGPVEDTSVDIFIARLGKWKIEWLAADDAAADTWESLLSQRAFASQVSDALRNYLEKIESGMEHSELQHAVDGLPEATGGRLLQDF